MTIIRERVHNSAERISSRRECMLSRRSSDSNICYLHSKEPSLSNHGLKSEDRCTFLLVSPDGVLCNGLVPFYLFLHGSDANNHLGTKTDNNQDCLEMLEPSNTSPKCPGSAESAAASSSSVTSVLGKSCTRSNKTISIKNSFTASQGGNALHTTSGSAYDGFDVDASASLISNIPKMQKSVKRRSRRKGKKKGKHYKKFAHKSISDKLETQSEESICHSSNYETSIDSHSSSPSDDISQNISEMDASSLPLQDTNKHVLMEIKDDCIINLENCTNRSAALLQCTSSNVEKDDSQPMASSPWQFSMENLSHDQSGRYEKSNFAKTPSSISSAETILSPSSSENTSVFCLNQGCTSGTSLRSDDHDTCSKPNLFPDKLNVGHFVSCSDVEDYGNTATQLPIKNGYIISGKGSAFDSVDSSAPFQSIAVDFCDISSEKSTYCSSNSSDWSNYVIDADCFSERAQCSSQASSSDDFHPVVYRKRGRLGRKASGSSNGFHRSDSVNLHGWTGKDNNHSIWQKVPKNGKQGCISRTKKANPIRHEFESSPKFSEVWKRSAEEKGLKQKSTDSSCCYSFSREKVGDIAQTNPIASVSKGANSRNLLAEPIAGRVALKFPENLGKKLSSASNQERQDSMEIGSHLNSLCSREFASCVIMPTDCQSEALQGTRHNIKENLQEKSCTVISDASKCVVKKEVEPLSTKSESLAKAHSCYAMIDSKDSSDVKVEIQIVPLSGNVSDTLFQNSVSVGGKDIAAFDIDNSNFSDKSGSAPYRLNSSKSDGGLQILSNHCTLTESTCFPPHEADENTCKSFGSLIKKPISVVEGKVRSLNCLETDLWKIMQAANESCKLLNASHTIQLVTGSPLADFERLLHSASPSLCQTKCTTSCITCSEDEAVGNVLCIHQVPRISLGKLWQWYEKLGNYGLEVKVEDCYNSKRSRYGCSQFRAYFVPYLSAVQLFARSGSTMCVSGDEENKASKPSSCLENLPIFFILLPQVRKVAPFDKVEFNCNPISRSDEELLFEYFETEQPQQRKSLFEKIKELVGGETSSSRQMFGDPSLLEHLNLHDLHPASWFSVAWYPIYRIPDGNFRAAFLTYHSLGHFVRRSTSYNLIGGTTEIVSPVVGMQTYNAKGECWFEKRFSVEEKAMALDPAETLNERLKTLEHAASAMASATVCKNNQKSVNRHPDYEFFRSRRL